MNDKELKAMVAKMKEDIRLNIFITLHYKGEEEKERVIKFKYYGLDKDFMDFLKRAYFSPPILKDALYLGLGNSEEVRFSNDYCYTKVKIMPENNRFFNFDKFYSDIKELLKVNDIRYQKSLYLK